MYWLLLQAVFAFFLIYVTQPILSSLFAPPASLFGNVRSRPKPYTSPHKKIHDKKSENKIKHVYLLYIYKQAYTFGLNFFPKQIF
jgi:hypothetical protein